MAITLFESNDTFAANHSISTSQVQYPGMTFTPSISHYLSKIALRLKRSATGPDFTIAISVQLVTGGDPDGVDLTGGKIIDLVSVTQDTDGEWVDIEFTTNPFLTAGLKYAIIARATGTTSGSQFWKGVTAASSYENGNFILTTDDGSSWTDYSTRDACFREYGGTAADLGLFVPETDRSFNKKLVAVGSNTLFYESSNALTELTDARDDIDTSNLLQIAPAYQKVFIVNETKLKVADFGNVKLSTADIVGAGSRIPVKGDLLTGSSSGAKMVVDFVTAATSAALIYGQRITSATFTSSDNNTTSADNEVNIDLDANEVAGPHWYDWTVFAALAATYGTMPNFASLICLYRGRVVISGNKQYPFQWYMSRQNHPFDFNYASNDAQTAVAGGNADAGELGDIVTALIPYKDDYLVFGCGSEIWYAAGDPAHGGTLNELDLTTGIYGAQAWCFDNAGNLFFWGTNGVYKTTIPGIPINISQVHLPNLVKDEAIDSSTHRITLEYDPRRNGILITITKFSDNTHSNYFYDLLTQGFFPESSHADCAIYSQLFYQGDAPDYRRLLVGCADGYIRYYDEDTESDIIADDTVTAIDAYCTWGPLKLAQNDDYYGILSALEVITAGGASGGSQADSSNVSYNIFVADTAEELLEKLAANTDYRVTGTIIAPGRPKGAKIRKRFRGMFLGLRLWNSTAAETWAINKIIGTIKKGGRYK